MAGVAKSMGSTLFSSLTIFDGFPLLGSLATVSVFKLKAYRQRPSLSDQIHFYFQLAGLFSLDGDTAKFDSLSSQRNGTSNHVLILLIH